jgi:uncharacterized protein (TIGR03437 family)
MPRAGNVAHIEFDPNQPNTVYATYTTFNAAPGDNHVYRSTDGGITWTGIDGAGSAGLPDIPVETILIDPADSTRLYLGTDVGMFASFDAGNTWVRDDDPFANVIVMNLVLDGSGAARTLYAFTYGRGVWRVPLPPAASNAATCSYSVSPTSITADATGGVYPVTVSTGAGCAWSARTTAPLSAAATLQAPGSGTGNGQAFLAVAPASSLSPTTTTFLVQNQSVTVTQPPAGSITAGDEISSASTVPAMPYAGATTNSQRTQNPADPQHSCTGSADYQTGWLRFTAPQSGSAQVTLQGTGSKGQAVLTAYPAVGQGIGGELACATVILTNSVLPQTVATVSFPVTSGAVYFLELSTVSPSTVDSLYFGISMAKPSPVFALSPPEAVVAPGGSQQFQPVVSNLGNGAVRWLIFPQVGVITPAGVYLAPAQLSAPTEVTLTAQSLGNASLQSSSTVTVRPGAPVSLGATALTNAASYQTGAVAPGEIVTIFGAAIGPAGIATAQLNAQGRLSSTLNGTQVLFDNIPAPLVYVSANQVSAIVPYEVAGQPSTNMVVVRNQQSTPPLTLPVTAVAPALFTSSASGVGQAAAVNQDTTLNSPGNGAPAGSVLSLYGTGEGQTSPGGINGRVANGIYPAPLDTVSVTIGGMNATVQYAGAAPEATAGLLQVNVVVPGTLAPGTYPVVLSIGGQASAAGVTVTVR